MSISLILGGARSGKSAYAQKIAEQSGLPVTYIATAQVYDDEFGARVALHRQSRPSHWKTVETPHQLAESLQLEAAAQRCVVVDCLTLWLAQCICPDCAPAEGVDWQRQREDFLAALPTLPGRIILVSNEVGMCNDHHRWQHRGRHMAERLEFGQQHHEQRDRAVTA